MSDEIEKIKNEQSTKYKACKGKENLIEALRQNIELIQQYFDYEFQVNYGKFF